MAGRLDALLVTEPGGHLLEMWAMRDVVARDRRAWCTVASPDVRSLLRDEDVTTCHGPTCRSVPNLLRNLRVAWRVVRRRRPRVILCTGSGVIVPFAWVGRLLGAHVIYVECGGRVDKPSLSCRIAGPVAHRTYVQWPELAGRVRGARFSGRLPWGGVVSRPSVDRPRTLISVGTSRVFPFDRLVGTAGHIESEGQIVVQRGPSGLDPAGATVVDFMSFDELSREMAVADAVVTHAGIGSVLLALMHGHRPIVMARRPALGECVDEHQEHFARRLVEERLAVVIEDPEEVGRALNAIRSDPSEASASAHAGDLLEHIAYDVQTAIGER